MRQGHITHKCACMVPVPLIWSDLSSFLDTSNKHGHFGLALNVNGAISAVSFPQCGNLFCPIKPLKQCPADSDALSNKQQYQNGYYHLNLSSGTAHKVITKCNLSEMPEKESYQFCAHVLSEEKSPTFLSQISTISFSL